MISQYIWYGLYNCDNVLYFILFFDQFWWSFISCNSARTACLWFCVLCRGFVVIFDKKKNLLSIWFKPGLYCNFFLFFKLACLEICVLHLYLCDYENCYVQADNRSCEIYYRYRYFQVLKIYMYPNWIEMEILHLWSSVQE